MNGHRKFHLFWSGTMALIFFTLCLPLLLLMFWQPRLLRHLRKELIRFLFLIMGVRSVLVGKSVPEGPALIIGNHHSWLDVLLLIARFPANELVFLGNANLKGNYFTTLFMRQTDIPIVPGRPSNHKKAMDLVRKRLRQGYKVVFFPEGGIVEPWTVPFKTGAFRMAQEMNVSLIPVHILGAERIAPLKLLNKGTTPGRVILNVHSPQNPELWTSPEQAATEIRAQMREEAAYYADNQRIDRPFK